jgi:hypothetical protein
VKPDKRHYLVVVDYGPLGCVYIETKVENTGRENTIADALAAALPSSRCASGEYRLVLGQVPALGLPGSGLRLGANFPRARGRMPQY